jgi:alkanesulfonate monooxygenase SsuD/methylene tetrahydromethanopterin reductase-like flavin-dependent oxidoreductase (luciferase family)
MKVGIFQDLRNPPRWRREPAQHYRSAIERVLKAEALGLDSVWLSEHHLFEDGYLPQPFVYAAALAARTSTIRVGTAITVAPLYPAIDLAEKATMVDLISDGRFILGLGAGYRQAEYDAFGKGTDIKQRFALLEQRARAVREYLQGDIMTPQPIQTRMPMFIGALGVRGARLAGRLGEGLLSLRPDQHDSYLAGLAAGGHARSSATMTGLANLILSRDPERAWPRLAPHLAYQVASYAHYGADAQGGVSNSVPHSVFDRTLQNIHELRSAGPVVTLPNFDIVTLEDAAKRLHEWLSPLPVGEVFFWDSIAAMPDSIVDEHLELLAVLKTLLRDRSE